MAEAPAPFYHREVVSSPYKRPPMSPYQFMMHLSQQSIPAWFYKLHLVGTLPEKYTTLFFSRNLMVFRRRHDLGLLRVMQLLEQVQVERSLVGKANVLEVEDALHTAHRALVDSLGKQAHALRTASSRIHCMYFKQLLLKARINEITPILTEMNTSLQDDSTSLEQSPTVTDHFPVYMDNLTSIAEKAESILDIDLRVMVNDLVEICCEIKERNVIDSAFEKLQKLVVVHRDFFSTVNVNAVLDKWYAYVDQSDGKSPEELQVMFQELKDFHLQHIRDWTISINQYQSILREACDVMKTFDQTARELFADELEEYSSKEVRNRMRVCSNLVTGLNGAEIPLSETYFNAVVGAYIDTEFVIVNEETIVDHWEDMVKLVNDSPASVVVMHIRRFGALDNDKFKSIVNLLPVRRKKLVMYGRVNQECPRLPKIKFDDFDADSKKLICDTLLTYKSIEVPVKSLFEGKPAIPAKVLIQLLQGPAYYTQQLDDWLEKMFKKNSYYQKIVADNKNYRISRLIAYVLARNSPLHLAVLDGDVDEVKTYLRRGHGVDYVDGAGRNAVHVIGWASGRKLQIARALMTKGPLTRRKDYFCGLIPAQYIDSAISDKEDSNQVALHVYIIRKILHPDMVDLHFVLQYGLVNTLKFLLQSEEPTVTSSWRDKRGNTLGHLAIMYNQYECLQVLLEKGLDVNSVNAQDETLLFFAISCRSCEMSQLLLSKGAITGSGGLMSMPPLFVAVGNKDFFCTRLLLKKGADGAGSAECSRYFPDIRNMNLVNVKSTNADSSEQEGSSSGEKALDNMYVATPLHIACWCPKYLVLELLVRHGGQVHATDSYGNTPLHLAAFKGLRSTVKMLLAHNASPNAKNNFDLTPMDYAKLNNNTPVVYMLRYANSNPF